MWGNTDALRCAAEICPISKVAGRGCEASPRAAEFPDPAVSCSLLTRSTLVRISLATILNRSWSQSIEGYPIDHESAVLSSPSLADGAAPAYVLS